MVRARIGRSCCQLTPGHFWRSGTTEARMQGNDDVSFTQTPSNYYYYYYCYYYYYYYYYYYCYCYC